jgi:CheY-like chemotaxis protein
MRDRGRSPDIRLRRGPTFVPVRDPIGNGVIVCFPTGVLTMESDSALPGVFIVDDDDIDRLLAYRALRRIGVRNPVHVFASGNQFMTFVEGAVEEVGKENRIAACLVLVDLRMPPPDGFEILQWMRRRAELSHVQVVVLTGSVDPKDMRRAAELRADLYLPKFPSDETLARVVAKASAAAMQALRVASLR